MTNNKEFTGYHKFRDDNGAEYGSFEVFHEDEPYFAGDDQREAGWYWWSCFPGCMPDGEQNGPFPTAEGAYLDALEGNSPHDGDDVDIEAMFIDTAVEEGTRFERLFDGNDVGG